MANNDTLDTSADQDTTGRTVVGLFTRRADAEAAIRALKGGGFTDEQIGVALQDPDEQRDLMASTGSSAAEGAATGALSGGMVGGVIGLLGSLLIPGVGPIVVGGVLASALTGAGIGAATGGLIGALVGMGVPEADAKHFDLGLRSGHILVTVDAGARTGEALTMLERHGMDFGPSGAQRYGGFDRASAAGGMADAGTTGDSQLAGLDAAGVGMPDDGIGGTGGSDAGIGRLPGAGLGGIGLGDVASGSTTGTRGFPSVRERSPQTGRTSSIEPWAGQDRRAGRSSEYAGPERRLAGV